VTVYVGKDPLTGKRIDLSETVPAGPDAAKQAEKVRIRLLNQLDERRRHGRLSARTSCWTATSTPSTSTHHAKGYEG
jgi:hypothetical protein